MIIRLVGIVAFGIAVLHQKNGTPLGEYISSGWVSSSVAAVRGDGDYFTSRVANADEIIFELMRQASISRLSPINNVNYPVDAEANADDFAGIGSLSERFESNGNPGAIGFDRVGGHSYGAWQISTRSKGGGHGTMPSFIKWLDSNDGFYADSLRGCGGVNGAKNGTEEFKACWKRLAADSRFYDAQKSFIHDSHYAVQAKILADKGIDISTRSSALRDVVWSTAVQHGGETNVISSVYRSGMSDADLIVAIYEERGTRFKSSTSRVRAAVKKRFVREKNAAIAMLRGDYYG